MKPTAPAPDSEYVIDVADAVKTFKDIRAVDGVTLRIKRGEYVALLGPNGAGKTTLVEMIEGIQFPDAGKIRMLGRPWKGHDAELRKRIGLSLQETRFIDKLTAEETLLLFASFYGQDRARVEEVLAQVGLMTKRRSYVVNLSGGQRQKLALGVAILNHPEILILDEPTIGLDPNSRREIWNILKDYQRRCATLILTTHYMEEAQYLCERIIIMHQGRFLTEGTFGDLLAKHADGDLIEFTLRETPAEFNFSEVPEIVRFHWNPSERQGRLVVRSKMAALLPFLDYLQRSDLTLETLEFRTLSLDDLFISLTGRHLDEE